MIYVEKGGGGMIYLEEKGDDIHRGKRVDMKD